MRSSFIQKLQNELNNKTKKKAKMSMNIDILEML